MPWEDLRYLFGQIMYGGHITDDWDRRPCQTFSPEFVKPPLSQTNGSAKPYKSTATQDQRPIRKTPQVLQIDQKPFARAPTSTPITILLYLLLLISLSLSKVPWQDLRYLFGQIMYGGHITDDWNRRLCRTLRNLFIPIFNHVTKFNPSYYYSFTIRSLGKIFVISLVKLCTEAILQTIGIDVCVERIWRNSFTQMCWREMCS